jgi:hypothetical protein
MIEFIKAIIDTKDGLVDYSGRKRDTSLVTDIEAFCTSINNIQTQLSQIDISHIVTKKKDIFFDKKEIIASTTLESELMNANSHTIHHMAIIKIICAEL